MMYGRSDISHDLYNVNADYDVFSLIRHNYL